MVRRKKESDKEFLIKLINKQFEINGYEDINYDILIANKEAEDAMPFGEEWFSRFTTTKEKEQEFRGWLEIEIKKRYKYLRGKALQTQVGMFLLMWGLKCSDCWDFLNKEE